jgi:hypothetical protein
MHSQIPPGWVVDLDDEGQVRFRRASDCDEQEVEPGLKAALLFLLITATCLAALSTLVLILCGVPLREIPALLGIPI